MSGVHIERKGHEGREHARTLWKAMREADVRDLNAAEAAAISGLPVERASTALFHLAKTFPARLRVTESGALYFTFERLERKKPQSALERAQAFWEHWGGTIVAVATFTLGPVVLAAIGLNAMGILDAAYREAPVPALARVGAYVLVPLSYGLALGLLMYNPLIGLVGLTALVYAMGLGAFAWQLVAILALLGAIVSQVAERLLRVRGGELNNWLDWAYGLARGFLFGPAPASALADEQRLTAAIAEAGQVLSVRDLMLLFGWTKEEAESELPRLVVDYGGELMVTEGGALVMRFDALPVDVAYLDLDIDLRPAVDRQGPPRLWGCPAPLGVALLLTCAFLIWGIWVHPLFSLFPGPSTWARLRQEEARLAFYQGFGAVPYLLAIACTAVRVPAWLLHRRAYAGREGFRELMRLLAASPEGGPVREVDAEALESLGGDVDMERQSARGTWVRFPLLEAGHRAAEAMREAGHERDDTIVYETGA